MKTKAIGLLSGGLDSILAVLLVKEQDIEVLALNFVTPFTLESEDGCRGGMVELACRLGAELRVQHLGSEYLEMLKDPAHGYGRNMNPCIDCHAFMLREARKVMEAEGATFVFTGEVLGERPMSQHRRGLQIVERESGLEGRLLRPLSALLLPPTAVEEQGIVDRARLHGISGRSRKPQIRLAQVLGVTEYPAPAGGCLLTDPLYSRKVKDLITFGELDVASARLLRVGRHYRLGCSAKLVVGRDQTENAALEGFSRGNDVILSTFPIPGPVGLLRGGNNGSIELSARVCAYHSDARNEKEVPVSWRRLPDEATHVIRVAPLASQELEGYRI
jgi:tRNA-specific 2-thiouridylase